MWIISSKVARLCPGTSHHTSIISTLQLFQRYLVHIQYQLLNPTQAKSVLVAAETRVGGLQVRGVHLHLENGANKKVSLEGEQKLCLVIGAKGAPVGAEGAPVGAKGAPVRVKGALVSTLHFIGTSVCCGGGGWGRTPCEEEDISKLLHLMSICPEYNKSCFDIHLSEDSFVLLIFRPNTPSKVVHSFIARLEQQLQLKVPKSWM